MLNIFFKKPAGALLELPSQTWACVCVINEAFIFSAVKLFYVKIHVP